MGSGAGDTAQTAEGDGPGRREVDFDESNYVLYQYADGALEIHAMANRSAAYYFIEHRLDSGEVERYRARGKAYLKALANRVRRQGK